MPNMFEIRSAFLICILTCGMFSGFAQQIHAPRGASRSVDTRSDSTDLLHFDIHLDISDFAGRSISGYADIQITPKVNNIHALRFDLLALSVDSVMVEGTYQPFNYNDTLLNFALPSAKNIGDTFTCQIHYGGQPVEDASGFGGFDFTNGYAYNIGVGFEADPHNYGRVWFPCYDNFVERASFDYFITTDTVHRAVCGGLLSGVTQPNNGKHTWHWQMTNTIPSYLASVAVGPYVTVDQTHQGVQHSFPVQMVSKATDTTKMKNSFQHLHDGISSYENLYGAYSWSRVGYVAVPFNGGAMEHSTNIAYPIFAIDNTLNYEDLMAHELAHQWWGDLVTCSTPEDMWINEGWAEYSSLKFFEDVYGVEEYKNVIRENHKFVLQFAHVRDDGYRAISGVPHAYTYGTHVYQKGADVAHTLRGYLGDQLFSDCLTTFLNDNAFSDVSSEDFRDDLTACTGRDLTPFFDNWVFNPGFCHFAIDSVESEAVGSEFEVTVSVRQKIKQAPAYYEAVPMDITFFDASWQQETRRIEMSGGCGVYTTVLDFDPIYIALDLEERISDATSDNYLVIDSVDHYHFEGAMLEVDVDQISDPAFVRIIHNWVAPDPFKTSIPGLHISRERFWTVEGILPSVFNASAEFVFNATTFQTVGFLDLDLFTNVEDSLVMLYRASTSAEWTIDTSHIVNIQVNNNNGRALVNVENLRLGEYAFGIWDHARPDSASSFPADTCIILGNSQMITQDQEGLAVFPNPTRDKLNVRISDVLRPGKLMISDLSGKLMQEMDVPSYQSEIKIGMKHWSTGTYIVKVGNVERESSRKFVLVR